MKPGEAIGRVRELADAVDRAGGALRHDRYAYEGDENADEYAHNETRDKLRTCAALALQLGHACAVALECIGD